MPRTHQAPQQPSATDPEFEQRLKEGISGLSNGKYSNQTVAARALKVCKSKCVHKLWCDHIDFLGFMLNTNPVGKGFPDMEGSCHPLAASHPIRGVNFGWMVCALGSSCKASQLQWNMGSSHPYLRREGPWLKMVWRLSSPAPWAKSSQAIWTGS